MGTYKLTKSLRMITRLIKLLLSSREKKNFNKKHISNTTNSLLEHNNETFFLEKKPFATVLKKIKNKLISKPQNKSA